MIIATLTPFDQGENRNSNVSYIYIDILCNHVINDILQTLNTDFLRLIFHLLQIVNHQCATCLQTYGCVFCVYIP